MKFVKIMRKYENKSGFWIRERLKISKIRKYAIMVDRENKEGINRIGVVHILLLQNLKWLNPSPLPSLRDEIKKQKMLQYRVGSSQKLALYSPLGDD